MIRHFFPSQDQENNHNMDHNVLILILLTQSFLLCSNATAQQNYSGNSILTCKNNDTIGPSPAFLYTCNGLNKSCLAFLIFKSQPPYTTTITISNLTSSNPEELTRINNATMLTVFPSGKEVIVPVNCSCLISDYYYQAESKYVLPPKPTYFTVANNTYQGLTTCDSLIRANPYGVLDLLPGMELHVPLRCACPTKNQITMNSTKYLLTYPVNWGDNITNIAKRFNVTAASLVDANGFSSQNQILYPFTTVLIPLTSEPKSSITIIHKDQPAPSPPIVSINRSNNKTKRKLLVSLATTGSFILVFCVVLSAVFLFRKRRARFFKRGTKGKTVPVSSEDIREEIACIEHLSKVYRLKEIEDATENFSLKNRIKGSVYRGVFGYDKDILAIKKMNADASKEVNLLGRINHFNLIKLKGYCKNDGLFCLVFEYMANGSLREWLGKSGSTGHNSWAKRIQIALDIANGLEYLHSFTEPCYVHKGISTDNILLNSDLRAKIANFTLAEESKSEVTTGSPSSTLNIVGTRGYMAPEYVEAGIVTSKMDVYAFGVVLLELITGKDSIIVQDGREVMLSAVMVSLIDEDDAEERLSLLIDPRLSGNSGKVFSLQLVRLSLACLMEEPARRPNMAEVVSSLLKIYSEMNRRISPSMYSSSTPLER